jgi:hypothetical protein
MSTPVEPAGVPPPLHDKPAKRNRWRAAGGVVIVAALALGALVGFLYFTKIGWSLRYTLAPRYRAFKIEHLVSQHEILAAGRTVLAAPTAFRKHDWIQSNPPKVYQIDPRDPQLPKSLRGLDAVLITVTAEAVIVRFEFGWGRNSGLIILPEGASEAPGYARGGLGPWKLWKEMRKGLYYYEGFLNSER